MENTHADDDYMSEGRRSITYALTRSHRSSPKGSLTQEYSAPTFTCLSPDAGVELEATQKRPEGGKLVRRGNAHFKGQEGEMLRWGEEDGVGNRYRTGRRGEGFCVASSRGTWDTLHMSTSMKRPPHSQSNVNLISSGMKEANDRTSYSSSFHRNHREMKTSFREL